MKWILILFGLFLLFVVCSCGIYQDVEESLWKTVSKILCCCKYIAWCLIWIITGIIYNFNCLYNNNWISAWYIWDISGFRYIVSLSFFSCRQPLALASLSYIYKEHVRPSYSSFSVLHFTAQLLTFLLRHPPHYIAHVEKFSSF